VADRMATLNRRVTECREEMRLSSSGRSSHALLTFQRLRRFFIAITHFAVNTSRLSVGIVPGP
jgi:hypothetical protein